MRRTFPPAAGSAASPTAGGRSQEPCGRPRRRTRMRSFSATALASGLLVFPGCGSDNAGERATAGVTGHVTLGPTCPVESAGTPSRTSPAANVEVTVSEALPGEAYGAGPTVARGTTDSEGFFRIAVPLGAYIVTARAGMSCELMDARDLDDTFVTVTVTCDTGIR